MRAAKARERDSVRSLTHVRREREDEHEESYLSIIVIIISLYSHIHIHLLFLTYSLSLCLSICASLSVKEKAQAMTQKTATLDYQYLSTPTGQLNIAEIVSPWCLRAMCRFDGFVPDLFDWRADQRRVHLALVLRARGQSAMGLSRAEHVARSVSISIVRHPLLNCDHCHPPCSYLRSTLCG